ncbi:MAG: DUF3793 family protein [Oscillospiraceae bacterium]|nr:DUF3793 family protein [Oscillospiraceae bacterium]
MEQRFESQLIFHCAPVLSGKKPSNLVCFSRSSLPLLPELLTRYTQLLESHGLALRILDQCEHRWMLLVYRPDMLERYLSSAFVRKLLAKDGYDEASTLDELLDHLSYRLQTCDAFPHEIGLFLGYRAADVICFQKYRGEGCKLCGYWKVYCSVKRSRKCFRQFDSIRSRMLAMLEQGYCLESMLAHPICAAA